MKQNGSFSSAILPDALLFWLTEICCVARISPGRAIRFLSSQRFPLLHQVQHIFSLLETKKKIWPKPVVNTAASCSIPSSPFSSCMPRVTSCISCLSSSGTLKGSFPQLFPGFVTTWRELDSYPKTDSLEVGKVFQLKLCWSWPVFFKPLHIFLHWKIMPWHTTNQHFIKWHILA